MKANCCRSLSFAFAAIAMAFLVSPAHGQVITINFSGTLQTKVDGSNLLPANITASSPFTGSVSYDLGISSDSAPADTNYGYYLYGAAGGFNMSVVIAGNSITSLTPTSAPNNVLITHNQSQGTTYDELLYESVVHRLNGAPIANVTSTSMDVDFIDSTGTALNSDVRPSSPPTLNQFPSLRRWSFYGTSPSGAYFYLDGDITSIGTNQNQQPALSISRSGASSVVVSWPLPGTGFFLEQSPTVTGTWSQVSFPYVTNASTISITTSSAGVPKFYRLRKP